MKLSKKPLLLLSLCLFSLYAHAQIGVYGIYKFVNLAPSSRIASLGGNLISVKDDDVTLAIQNPSLLNKSMSNHFAISYLDYLAGTNFGSLVYARNFDSSGRNITAMAGMQYINYGEFVRADEAGNKLGTFSAGEYNFFVGASRQWKRFSYGGQLKFIYSQYDVYKSSGAAVDLSGTYYNPIKRFTAALVVKNMGFQFQTYDKVREPLPFEVQAGISIWPKQMPFRFSVIAHDLNRMNMTYRDTNLSTKTDFNTGVTSVVVPPFSEQIFRHLIFGVEVIISKNFNLRVGYNHEMRKEMTIENNRGLVGYSFGAGFRVNRFHISYGRSLYSVAGGTNTFTITTNFNDFMKQGKKPGA